MGVWLYADAARGDGAANGGQAALELRAKEAQTRRPYGGVRDQRQYAGLQGSM